MELKNIALLAFLIFMISIGSSYSQRLSIDEVVRIAIENNQEIKSAKLNIEKEEAVKLKSFNIPRPELFMEYEGIKGSLKNFESRKIGIAQEFEFPTSYFLRADVQGSQVNIAKQELNKRAYNIKYEVQNAYLRLLLSYKLLEIAKENLRIYNDFLFVAEKKYDAGSTSNLEVLGAKVNKIKFENQVKNFESEISVAKSELRKLMGVAYFDIEPTDELNFKELVLLKDEIMRAALINNPDLKIINYQKEKFSNKISLSRSELLPNLSLKYFRQKIGNDGDFWGVEFGVGIPLWFWWEPTGNIKEANYELEIAVSNEVSTKKSIENDVNQTFEEYENSLRQTRFFNDEALREVNEVLRQAKISYEEGAIDYVEYLQALQIVYETRTQYLNAVYNYNKSIIKLENLIAGELK
jgi:heavy metal efflux system protein